MNLDKLLSAFPEPDPKRKILSNIDKEAMEKAIEGMLKEPANVAKALVNKLEDPAAEGNADVRIRHAIHAIAIRIPSVDKKKRSEYAEALASTLAEDHPEAVKAFVIRQIQVCGGKEVIPHLGKFLTIGGLADDAAQALLAIGGDHSAKQFRAAWPKSQKSVELRRIQLHGLAESSDSASKDIFLKALSDKDVECRLLAMWGLVQVADKGTIDAFLKAEQKEEGYARNKAAHLTLQFAEKVCGSEAKKIYSHIARTRTGKTEKHLVALAESKL